jgi:hypothetical protein
MQAPPPGPPRSGRPGVRDPAPDPKCLLTCAEQSRRQEQAGGKEEGALLVQVVESTCGQGAGWGPGSAGAARGGVLSSDKGCGQVGRCGQLCAAVCSCVMQLCVCIAAAKCRVVGGAAEGEARAPRNPQGSRALHSLCIIIMWLFGMCVLLGCRCLHVCAGVCWCLHGACVCAQVRSMHPATPAAAGRGARRGPACA